MATSSSVSTAQSTSTSRSPGGVSMRPRACPYSDYVTQQQRTLTCRNNPNGNKALQDGPRLWRQMMMGFMCAGFVGLVMLVLGTVFIAEAVSRQQPITVMLCVMGIVFGIIILVGTFILGKVIISRKWVRCHDACHGQEISPAGQCFHTCSVIYSPSLDQLGATESMLEPPPSYDTVVPVMIHHTAPELTTDDTVVNETGERSGEIIFVHPPKYEEVTKPLPEYFEEEVLVSSPVPSYKERESDENQQDSD